jgi:hypothetical protein
MDRRALARGAESRHAESDEKPHFSDLLVFSTSRF